MGGIRFSGVKSRSKTSIEIEFRYRGVKCRETIPLPPTPANIKHCERLKKTVEHEIATGVFDYAKRFPSSSRAAKLTRLKGNVITVADQLRTWIDSIQAEVQPETWDEYEKDIRNKLIPEFGEKPLTQLTRGEVREWAGKTGLSLKRLNNILIPLRSMYSAALQDEIIERNPIADLELKRPPGLNEDKIDPFDQDEIAAIVKHSSPMLANMVTFWAWSGLRTGELVGLAWPDIDFRRGVIRVARAVREGRTKVTKTLAGTREVKLLGPAREAIEAQRKHSQLAGKQVWLNPRTGEPWAGDGAIRKTAWVYALRAAGVRYRYPYQLRHTYASWMLSAGENPMWVANQMGHRDWAMITRVYGRWIPTVDPLAGSRAVALIAPEADGHNTATIGKKA